VIIAIATDHAGRPLYDRTIAVVRSCGYEPLLVGPEAGDPQDDYPDIARAVGTAVVEGAAQKGIAICGSGAGVSIAASKMHGVRAATAHDSAPRSGSRRRTTR
jgi:ribose 5-phosphate isomerase B